MRHFQKAFQISSGLMLFATGLAKLLSVYGKSGVLDLLDPITGLLFRHLLALTGVLELTVAVVCLLFKPRLFVLFLIALLSSNFCIYRLGMWWIGWHKPCNCLGNFIDVLHIKPETADTAMKIILAYLLIGSYGSLFWLWRQRKKAAASAAVMQ